MKHCVLMTLMSPLTVLAQPHSTPRPDNMDKLSFLVGRWEGNGWMEFGPGDRRACQVSEVVQRKVGGHALLVEGLGKAKLPQSEKEIVVHDALGVVSYDANSATYKMHAFKATGDSAEAEIKLRGQTLTWHLDSPRGGTVRFTITIDNAQWLEVGEFSQDGETWQQFFEMKLSRVG